MPLWKTLGRAGVYDEEDCLGLYLEEVRSMRRGANAVVGRQILLDYVQEKGLI